MVHKPSMDYLCYPAPNGPSIGRIVVESAVDGPKSICGPFEKFHSMLISAIHGKLQTHNIPPRRHSPSTTNFSSSMSKHSQMGRCRGETLMICTCSQADRQTDSAMTNRSSSPRKDANVLMRIHDRTHDKPIGKRNLRRQSRLFNDNGRWWWLWPGLAWTVQPNRASSSVIPLNLPRLYVLFAPAYWDHVIWLVRISSVLPIILWIHHTSLLLTVRLSVCLPTRSVVLLPLRVIESFWNSVTPLSGPQNGHTMDLFNSDREKSVSQSLTGRHKCTIKPV